ncbi:MAG: IS200/IS605 family transposase [Salibacteraceae bacterium]|nr:IS200/IS605 family transposase [Salibacteraceae bacterium]
MANTYNQFYFHKIFAVKGRENLIAKSWQNELYKYISGIVVQKSQKLYAINGMPNHVHLLISTKPNCTISDLIRDIKANSSKWINENKFVAGKFEWQTGFGGFTVSQSSVDAVVKYIQNQEEHHTVKSFSQEYTAFLDAYKIEYNDEFIFKDE